MTKYRVMVFDESGYLTVLTDVETHGPQQAMKKVAQASLPAANLERGVRMVAVPVTNWSEEPVQIRSREPILVVGGEQVTIEEALAEPLEEVTA